MENEQRPKQNIFSTIFLALLPLGLLGAVIMHLLSGGPTKIFQVEIPPVEEIHVLRHVLEKNKITLEVINSGPDPTYIAQVMVRGAFWNHEVSPKRELNSLETAQITMHYPWVFGEPYEILILTASGLAFDYEIEVAMETPKPTLAAFGRFAMLGIYVGVIPVALGIFWFPVLRLLRAKAMNFLLYLTSGLLAFLALEAVVEGLEVAGELPEVFRGTALLAFGLIAAYLILRSIDNHKREQADEKAHALALSWTVALGIGLHNLGEGLAIGSAYVLGELSLGTMLVVGFTIHNVTEGIAIIAPILKRQFELKLLVGLGLLAGAPTIIGCWIGAFTFSPVWAVLFLGIGAGAIIQVIGAIIGRHSLAVRLSPVNILGMAIGFLLMYATGLFVGGS